jgi:DNA adenine methylase
MTAIAPWFGGKRTMAEEIVAELGNHRAYWEPFCGSMAVLFAKEPASQETVIDMHDGLVNLARTLRSAGSAARLYARASRTLYSTDLYDQSAAWLDNWPGLQGSDGYDQEAAYHYFVVSWMGRNGTSGCVRTNWQPSIRYTPGGGSSSTRFRTAVESIPWWHERLRRVVILKGDAFNHLPKIPDMPGIAVYADPPYLQCTRGSGGGSRYLHDFTECNEADAGGLFDRQDDHARLAAELTRFKEARVVVSYYDHPRLESLYPGWTVRRMYRQKNLHVQNRRGVGKCEAPEVLLINGPSYATLETTA